MSGHADTIRPTIRHDKMRVLDTWGHPSSCPGCAADVALDALLAENQRLRGALERIKAAEIVEHSYVLRRIAREALAGDTE